MKLQSKGSASGFNSLGTPRSRRYRGPHSLHQSGFSIRARRFASRMISRIDSLASQPESGSWLPEDDSHQYRQIFHGTYRVIYRFADDTVLIVTVHHADRDFNIEAL